VSTHLARWELEESNPVHPQHRKERLDFTSKMMEPQQAGDTTQPYMGNINQIRNRLP
jgi:hypothetical protein